MKFKLSYSWALLALVVATGGLARAQSRVPAPDDYSAFRRFITDRNIFNPDRYPHIKGRPNNGPRPPVNRSAPAFSYVGTMVYGKGMFAFFDGNNNDYRKSLQASGTIAGYTVQEITLTNVVLAEGSNTLSLAVGSVLRRARDGTWVQSDDGQDFSMQTPTSASSGETPAAAASPDSPAAPSGSSPQMSDVLKRLMMQRQQENK